MFIIHRFRICKFSLFAKMWLQFQNQYPRHFFHPGPCAEWRNSQGPKRASPSEAEQGGALPSPSIFSTGNTCPFQGLFSATFFVCLCFLWVTWLFKTAPPACGRLKRCLMCPHTERLWCALRKKYTSDKLRAGESHGAVGPEFNEATVYIKVFLQLRNTHKTRLAAD